MPSSAILHAEIVAVGTELTTGAKLDTNSQWLSLALAEQGIATRFHTTVADDLEAMLHVLREAVHRSDLVLVTGGLGPTQDDITRHALAELVRQELVLNTEALAHIESLFRRRHRPMPERNRVQALFPAGSEMLPNPRGTAPGIWMNVSRKGKTEPALLAALPGVPSEMKRMFEKEVQPRLPLGKQVIRRARIHCFGVGESAAEEMLGDLTARGGDPDIGITVHEATITLRITAHGETPQHCDEKIETARQEIRRRMGRLVYGEEDEELHDVVVRLLRQSGQTLCTAESGTGGLLSYRLSETPHHRAVYAGGLVAADEESLLRLLPQNTTGRTEENPLENHPPASSPALPAETVPAERRQRAADIATSARRHFGADFALAVLDCPEFHPDDKNDEAPHALVAIADQTGVLVEPVALFGDPSIRKSRTAKVVLNLLRLKLLPACTEEPLPGC